MTASQRTVLLVLYTILLVAPRVDAFSVISMSAAGSAARHRLYDLPVSNNGARCRIIVYKAG